MLQQSTLFQKELILSIRNPKDFDKDNDVGYTSNVCLVNQVDPCFETSLFEY